MNVLELRKFLKSGRMIVLAHGDLKASSVSIIFDLMMADVCHLIKLDRDFDSAELVRSIKDLSPYFPIVFVVGGDVELWTSEFWSTLRDVSDTVLFLNSEGHVTVQKDSQLPVDTAVNINEYLWLRGGNK